MRKGYQWSKKWATFSFHCASGATSERQLCRDGAAGILQTGRVARRDSFDVGLIRADAAARREMVRLDLHQGRDNLSAGFNRPGAARVKATAARRIDR